MVRSKIEAFYEAKGVEKAIIQIEVDSFNVGKDGITFNVIDYVLEVSEENEIIKKPILMYTVFKDNSKVNDISLFLKQEKDYSEMSEIDAFWSKIKDELFYLVTNKVYENGMTDYRLLPGDWELI